MSSTAAMLAKHGRESAQDACGQDQPSDVASAGPACRPRPCAPPRRVPPRQRAAAGSAGVLAPQASIKQQRLISPTNPNPLWCHRRTSWIVDLAVIHTSAIESLERCGQARPQRPPKLGHCVEHFFRPRHFIHVKGDCSGPFGHIARSDGRANPVMADITSAPSVSTAFNGSMAPPTSNGTSEAMPTSTVPGLSADEIALYDRQIRLWGAQAQERIRSAHILLISLRALGTEIAKNLTLAGINSLTIIDDDVVTEEDLGTQYFVREDDVGKSVSSDLLFP